MFFSVFQNEGSVDPYGVLIQSFLTSSWMHPAIIHLRNSSWDPGPAIINTNAPSWGNGFRSSTSLFIHRRHIEINGCLTPRSIWTSLTFERREPRWIAKLLPNWTAKGPELFIFHQRIWVLQCIGHFISGCGSAYGSRCGSDFITCL